MLNSSFSSVGPVPLSALGLLAYLGVVLLSVKGDKELPLDPGDKDNLLLLKLLCLCASESRFYILSVFI